MKYRKKKIVRVFAKPFNKILKGDEIPEEIKLGYITTILRKGTEQTVLNIVKLWS